MQFSQTTERKPGSLIQSQSEFSKRDEGPISSPKETGRKQFNKFRFGTTPILAGDKIIQPKLTINQPGDQYEREADAMADKVMRMAQPESQTASTIQRRCAKCEAEEKKKKLQRKENNSNSPTVSTGLENYTNSLNSRGQPLSKETRNFFEPRFGYDFSHIRIHNDGMAVESAQSIQARAYTLGSHIVFNRGEFRPHSEDGKRLLGHELTHVVQQGKYSNSKNIQRLGNNPNCTESEKKIIHQSIFNARGWINNALTHLNKQPVQQNVLNALRRNFGNTYGVESNLPMIIARIRRVYRQLGTIPFSCAGGVDADATCDQIPTPCGWVANAGNHAVTICRSSSLSSSSWIYQTGCVLHEAFHATYSRFIVDEYSGWHGHSGFTFTYPGVSTEPLLNADSYTTLIMDLSKK